VSSATFAGPLRADRRPAAQSIRVIANRKAAARCSQRVEEAGYRAGQSGESVTLPVACTA